MPLILPGNVGSATAATSFNVANSLRFNSGSSDHLNRTTSSGNRLKWTWSAWIKKTKNGADEDLFSGYDDSSNYTQIQIGDTGRFNYINKTGGSQNGKIETNRVFRDNSAWYHFVIVWDSGNATAGNRMRIYVNGVEETSFATDTQPSENQVSHVNQASKANYIGSLQGTATFFNGYMAEVVLVDGLALTPTSFGEFDEDSPTIWKPKNVSGLTFGTNGFYLDFEDSSALGNDAAGSNNFTVNNLAATDQSLDTCTNNFCTMNSLDNFYAGNTFSEGNLKIVGKSDQNAYNTSTFGISNGKWYYEQKITSTSSNGESIGITDHTATATDDYLGDGAYEYGYYSSNGKVYNNGGNTAYGATFDTGDIMGIYIDLDNNKLYFAKNGTVQNSNTGISITAPASTPNGFYFVSVSDNGNTGTYELNFGSPTFAISSGNTDDNGYGNFEYSPNITGDSVAKKFYALNTKNLAEFG